jgi:hypothetical protein
MSKMQLKKVLRPFKNLIGDILIYSRWHSKKIMPTIGAKKNVSLLKRDGVVKLDFNFSEYVDELRSYLLDEKLCIERGCISSPMIEKGQTINIFSSFDLSAILKICTDNRLLQTLTAYYGSTPYLRNDPQFQRLQFQSEHQFDGNYYFHVDRFNQVSAMILLSEVTMETTHMAYARGSHKRRFGFVNLRKLKQGSLEQEGNINSLTHLTGSPGDIYLFDSMGLHKANYKIGAVRDCIFLNFTNGHNLYKWKAKSSDGLISEDAEHINRRSSKLVFADQNNSYRGHKYFHSDILNKL